MGTSQVLEEYLAVEAKVDRLVVEVLADLSLEDWVIDGYESFPFPSHTI